MTVEQRTSHRGGRSGTRTRPVVGRSGRTAARRDLVLFLAVVVALSAPLEYAIAAAGGMQVTSTILLVGALMWVPATSALIVRRATGQPRPPASRPRPSGGPVALLLPMVVGSVAYAAALATGLVRLADPSPAPWVSAVVVNGVANLVFVPGEELGWRGFMVPRLVESGVPAPLTVSGLIWGLWHVPLVLWASLVADGPAPWVSVVMLMATTTLLGHVLARLQIRTGSPWPAIWVHVIWNVVFQALLSPVVTGSHEGIWVGEFGVLTLLALAAYVAWSDRPNLRPTRPQHAESNVGDMTTPDLRDRNPLPRPNVPPTADDPDLRPLLRFAAAALPVGWVLLGTPLFVDLPIEPFVLGTLYVGLVLPTVLLTRRDRHASMRQLLRETVRPPRPVWLLAPAALLIPATTYAVGALLGRSTELDTGFVVNLAVANVLSSVLIVNLWEEMAWAGFVQRRLTARWGFAGGAVATALLFTGIHLPLSLYGADGAGDVAFNVAAMIASGIGMRLVIGAFDTWGRRSILALAVVHATFNASSELVDPDSDWVRYLVTLGLGLAAWGLWHVTRTSTGTASTEVTR